MKKGIIYIILLVALGGIAWYLLSDNKTQSSIDDIKKDYDFAIPDTASITKILIEDKTPSKVALTKVDGKWLVNEQYEARPDAIDVLLETVNRMEMRNFVPIPSQETIIKRLAVYGKEVHVYAGDKLIKHFYVGTETPDQTGTYMMIAGAGQPFSVHIPGFVGYLTTRFFTGEELWRRRVLFGVDKENISEITMNYLDDEAASFHVKYTNKTPQLFSADGQTAAEFLDVNMNIFLGSFRTASYEGMIVPTDGVWARKDSISSARPIFTLSITDNKGKTQNMKAFRKRPDKEQVDDDGLPMAFDPDRMYAFLDDGRWVLIQYYGLRNIIVEKAFFTQEILFDN